MASTHCSGSGLSTIKMTSRHLMHNCRARRALGRKRKQFLLRSILCLMQQAASLVLSPPFGSNNFGFKHKDSVVPLFWLACVALRKTFRFCIMVLAENRAELVWLGGGFWSSILHLPLSSVISVARLQQCTPSHKQVNLKGWLNNNEGQSKAWPMLVKPMGLRERLRVSWVDLDLISLLPTASILWTCLPGFFP